MLITARRVAETQRAVGNMWGVAEAEISIAHEVYCGRPAAAAARLPAAMLLAERIGHHSIAVGGRTLWATLSLARGDLVTAEREMEEARNFCVAHDVPWSFAPSIYLSSIAFLRGNFAGAERWFSDRTAIEEQTYWAGCREACLFAFRAEPLTKEDLQANAESVDSAWKAWTDRRWKLPRVGEPNPLGSWFALERSVVGLACLGRKEEAAALRPLTEELLMTGVWASGTLFPLSTVAGIAAACAGDWSAAEQHHLTAIHHTDTAPYRISQPIAREWYATMLLDRSGAGDAAKARGLLSESRAMYESMGMPFHVRRTSRRLFQEQVPGSPPGVE